MCILFILNGCSGDKSLSKYPMIDVASNVLSNNYKKVYFSDLFSTIEVIPLETKRECLVRSTFFSPVVTDSFIIMGGENIYVFDISGKFLNQIGQVGRGPGEYIYSNRFFLKHEQSNLYVEDSFNVLEYEINGKFINSFRSIDVDGSRLSNYSYVEDNVFVGSLPYIGNNEYKYCLVDQNGSIIKCFPNYIFFNMDRLFGGTYNFALRPVRVDTMLYLKDFVNDTIYVLSNLKLRPAYVFDFGKYSFPVEQLENLNNMQFLYDNTFLFSPRFAASSKYFFYELRVPNPLSRPKGRLVFQPVLNQYRPDDRYIFGIFDIEQETNILLDTDQYLQRGIINDINGGLSFFPKYYAGNGVVVDIWQAEDMKEILTEEYFSSIEIKDKEAHQKLREVLKNLDLEDNPVIVLAKLK